MLAASTRGQKEIDEAMVTRPALIFSCPAAMLLRPQGFPKKSHVLYQHIFRQGGSYPDQGFFYVGVTTRNWQKRWSEHRRNIKQGSLHSRERALSSAVLADDPFERSDACLPPEVRFSVNDLAIAGEEHVTAHIVQRLW